MDLSNLSISNGKGFLREIASLPVRIQELIFCLIDESISHEDIEPIKILGSMYLRQGVDFSFCESPIEQIFAFAYEMVIVNQGFPESELLNIYPQEEILIDNHKYYADFYFDTAKKKHFYYEHPLKVVIECDGHDYHEKTKEQVARGNKRDLDLKAHGYDVVHFSGSQIYKNPIECAQELYLYIKTKVGEIRPEL